MNDADRKMRMKVVRIESTKDNFCNEAEEAFTEICEDVD